MTLGGGVALTVHVSILTVSHNPLIAQHLHVSAARAAVQLVGARQSAARAVRQAAVLGHVLLEVRHGHGVQTCRRLRERKHVERNRRFSDLH